MKRRDFILIGTVGIAAVSVPSAYYFLRDIEYDSILAQPEFLSLIWDKQTIEAIGNQYRVIVPQEKSERSLVKLLVAEDSIQTTLEERIKNDFKTGNTIMIDGWILSVTEARQCALASAIQLK